MARDQREDQPGRKAAAGESLADGGNERRELSPAARRALAEAEERRRLKERDAAAKVSENEIGGQAGPDPVRYGDWEKDGIISDF